MPDIRDKLILEILEQFISQQNKFSVSTYLFFFSIVEMPRRQERCHTYAVYSIFTRS